MKSVRGFTKISLSYRNHRLPKQGKEEDDGPSKEENDVGKYLRWNCPNKTSTMMSQKVEYFVGECQDCIPCGTRVILSFIAMYDDLTDTDLEFYIVNLHGGILLIEPLLQWLWVFNDEKNWLDATK